MKPIIIYFSSLFFICQTYTSFGQTIRDVLQELPLIYTPELTNTAKDSLLKFGSYIIITDRNDVGTAKYTNEGETEKYIRLVWSWTPQNCFMVIELRMFKKINGDILVVYSRYAGSQALYGQRELRAFDFIDNKLTDNIEVKLPMTLDAKEYFKKDIPDSLLKYFADELNLSCNLDPEGNDGIEYIALTQRTSMMDWMNLNPIIFVWNGESFKKSIK